MARVWDAPACIIYYLYPGYVSSQCGSYHDVCKEHQFIGYMIPTQLFEQINYRETVSVTVTLPPTELVLLQSQSVVSQYQVFSAE